MSQSVLVIDDQLSMQVLARVVLQQAGYRVLLSGDGVIGLTLARLERPEVILLDWHAPGLDSLDFLHALRDDPHTAHIPVILITSSAEEQAVAAGLDAGATHSLQKPFQPARLREVVERVIAPFQPKGFLPQNSFFTQTYVN